MEFGGWSSFGGSSDFGGAESRAKQIYRMLKDLRPPFAYSRDDEALCNLMLRLMAVSVGDKRQSQIDFVERDAWPQTTDAMLPEWETMLGLVAGNQGVAARQDAVLAKWRGGSGLSVAEMRKILAPALNPTTAFRDTFESADEVSWRWTQRAGNGTITQASGWLTLNVAALANGDWTDADDDCPRVSVKLHSREDSVILRAQIADFAGNDATAGGIALFESATDAWLFGVVQDGGNDYFQVDRIEDGVLTRPVFRGDEVSVYPSWIEIRYADGVVSFWTSVDGPLQPTSYVCVYEAAAGSIRQREFAAWCRNSSPWNEAEISFEDLEFSHGLAENNVELIEMIASEVPAAAPEHIFQAFVHREPDDAGTYDIPRAQRIADSAKMGHVVIMVGESDDFLCDDEHSLTDRDVLGR